MTQFAEGFRQKMRDFVKSPPTPPTSNRSECNTLTSSGLSDISVISKSAVLHDKTTINTLSHSNSPDIKLNFAVVNSQCTSSQELNAEEIKILAQIEEQNRLLEQDSKSLKSVSSEGGKSRRSSNGSVSPTSLTPGSGVAGGEVDETQVGLDNKTWVMWGKIVNDWDDFKRRNGKQLKEMIRAGIPHHFRALVWQLLCNTATSQLKTQYVKLLRETSPSEKLIRRDIARTYPEQEFFKDGVGQEVLFNVIKAYSLVDREVGYCQGSAFIVGLLLMQMPEEEAFAVFVTLMREHRLRELFKPSMAELGLCMFQLENMLQDHAPELMHHFQAQGFHTSMFASSWFLTLFATTFDFELASRILDVYISEGMEVVFRVAMVILLSNQPRLLQQDMEGMLKFIQKDVTQFYNKDPDLLFLRAYNLIKYNPKKMKKLEKDYMTMRNKEQEEQIEIRRLRTENNLLRQRIDGLEAENGSLADKLIQDRVNRALEAEEKIIMGKELSIAKRQLSLANSPTTPSHNKLPGAITEPITCNGNSDDANYVTHLQQELVQSKLKEAETSSLLVELQDKICDLEECNRELSDQSSVSALQDELIAVKLREAECNGALKEVSHKLHTLEENWQKHMSRTTSRRAVLHANNKNSKVALQELQEQVMTSQCKEAKTTAKLAEFKQRVMELETTNQITTSQLRRCEDERSVLLQKSEISADKGRVMQQEINETAAKLTYLESKNQEAMMSLRLREAESAMKIAELQQQVSNLKLKNLEESHENEVTKNATSLPSPKIDDSTKIIRQLQTQILKQQRQLSQLRSDSRLSESLTSEESDSELVFDAAITAESELNLISDNNCELVTNGQPDEKLTMEVEA